MRKSKTPKPPTAYSIKSEVHVNIRLGHIGITVDPVPLKWLRQWAKDIKRVESSIKDDKGRDQHFYSADVAGVTFFTPYITTRKAAKK